MGRSERDDIYAATVRLLRDVTRTHASAAGEMCARGGRSVHLGSEAQLVGTGATKAAIVAMLADGPPQPEVEDLGAMLRALEDVGLEAVCRLARARDPEAAFEAIDEARAGWLREAALNRAAETFGRG
jgi:hypothetical protein